ncbi:MAG: hypothetical protein ABI432_11565 [Flavobacteriales bacterium]
MHRSYITLFAVVFAAVASAQGSGELDLTFSGDGIVTTDFPTNNNDYGTCIVVQPNGRIVVGGSSSSSNGAALALARFMSDGALDISFGTGGFVTTEVGSFPTLDDQLLGLAVQSDGKIVAVGSTFVNGGGYQAVVVRYNTDGTLDNSFSGDGVRVENTGTGSDDPFFAVAIAADGRIVVTGRAQNANGYDVVVGRYTSDGVPDDSFNGNGFVVTDIAGLDDHASALVIQPDGRIVISGRSETIVGNDDLLLARYTASGALDSSFGIGGVVVSTFTTGDDWAYSLALQPDGKLVAGGIVSGGFLGYMAVARYAANGTLDASFGSAGLATIVTGAYGYVRSLVVMPDGRIVGGGASDAGYAAAMLLPNGTLDNSFSDDGLVSHPKAAPASAMRWPCRRMAACCSSANRTWGLP